EGWVRSCPDMEGEPPVVRLTTASQPRLMAGRNSANAWGRWSGLPVTGSRACRWMMAAPASQAPIAASAISFGVTGRYGDIEGVWIEPVTAQVIMTFFC